MVDSTTQVEATVSVTVDNIDSLWGLLMVPSNFFFKPLAEVKSMSLMGKYWADFK